MLNPEIMLTPIPTMLDAITMTETNMKTKVMDRSSDLFLGDSSSNGSSFLLGALLGDPVDPFRDTLLDLLLSSSESDALWELDMSGVMMGSIEVESRSTSTHSVLSVTLTAGPDSPTHDGTSAPFSRSCILARRFEILLDGSNPPCGAVPNL